MATYLLFGKYSAEALKGISAKRSEDAKALFKKHGGELKAAYATLGDVDLVMIADLPDNARAMAASMALAKSTGIAFTTAPALTVDEFDKLGG
ncbi:MAG: GYD domain-containing protein [Pseudolabrys sp.]